MKETKPNSSKPAKKVRKTATKKTTTKARKPVVRKPKPKPAEEVVEEVHETTPAEEMVEEVQEPDTVDEAVEIPEEETTEIIEQHTETPMSDTSEINQKGSGFLDPVIKRDYAESAEVIGIDTSAPESEPVQEAVEKKSFFGSKPIVVQTDETYKKLQEPSVPVQVTDDVPSMSFEKPLINTSDDAPSASDQLLGHAGRTTSDFLWDNFENGIPELSYLFVRITDEKIKETAAPDQLKDNLLEKIAQVNKEARKQLEISEWHKKNIKPALRDFCIEKGIEQSIPAWAQLLFALSMFALVYGMMVMELKKSNKQLEKKMVDSLQAETDRIIKAMAVREVELKVSKSETA
jgi:hypothetical protein